MEGAKRMLAAEKIRGAAEKPRGMARCVVCSAEAAGGGSEPLCWVCRRLKISAWRDVEQPAPAQE
jgi:hypothetical protein